jgi:hypothetical protein
MQELPWLPSSAPNAKVVGKFEDGTHTYTDGAGVEKTIPVLWLKTKVPGVDHEVACRRVKDNPEGVKLKKEYSQAWDVYQKAKGAVHAEPVPTATEFGVKGTPIEDANFLGKDSLARLKLMGFLTLEQLADMSDTQCQNVGFGAKEWRRKAKEHLVVLQDARDVAMREGIGAVLKKDGENAGPSVADLMAQLADANAKIAMLMEMVAKPAPAPAVEPETDEAPKPRRGRRSKTDLIEAAALASEQEYLEA